MDRRDMRRKLHSSHEHRVVSNCRKEIEVLEMVAVVSGVCLKKKTIEGKLKE